MVYGFPEGLEMGGKYFIYDYIKDEWFYCMLKFDSSIAISILDLMSAKEEIELTQHKFDGSRLCCMNTSGTIFK